MTAEGPDHLTADDRDAIADACDAAYDFGDAWVRMLRSGAESMLLPVVEHILATHVAAAAGLRTVDGGPS